MPLRVLIVDDELLLLRSMERQLRLLECEVVTEVSPLVALEQHLGKREFDVVVSDYLMPRVTGLELLRTVMEQKPHVVRILMSGVVDASIASAAIASGVAHHVLEKPWQTGTFTGLIKKLAAERAPT